MIRVSEIQQAVAEHFGLTVDDLRGRDRAQRVAGPRNVAMYLSNRLAIRSLSQIGNSFGGRDHTTVISAVKRVAWLRSVDPEFNDDVLAVVEALK